MEILTLLLGVGSLALFAPRGLVQDKKPGGKGIDPAIVAAYEKLGAVYGGFVDMQDRTCAL